MRERNRLRNKIKKMLEKVLDEFDFDETNFYLSSIFFLLN